ncbi:MAG TPA: tryptophan--tRNA ligase, partial [Acidimicrobiales bacterium]|nr:tryptophan--tRNA ligase [Acidimicrobiales bacterium]
KRAVTDTDDSADPVRYDPDSKPGLSNLLELLATVEGVRPEEVAGRYTRYGPLKSDLAAAVLSLVEPIQARYRELAADPQHVAAVLQAGAERARKVSSATLQRAYDAVGLLPGRPGCR